MNPAKKVGISKSKIAKICEAYPEINATYLTTGVGEIVNRVIDSNVKYIGDAQKELSEYIQQVELVPHTATASFMENEGTDNRNIEYVGVIPHPGERFDKSYKVFEVSGESMYPSIRPRAKILCRQIPQSKWHYAEGVAVVVISDMILVKRITKNLLNLDNYIELSSDNPQYGKMIVQMSDIKAIFKAIRKIDEPID